MQRIWGRAIRSGWRHYFAARAFGLARGFARLSRVGSRFGSLANRVAARLADAGDRLSR
jgi:hypothetical protein